MGYDGSQWNYTVMHKAQGVRAASISLLKFGFGINHLSSQLLIALAGSAYGWRSPSHGIAPTARLVMTEFHHRHLLLALTLTAAAALMTGISPAYAGQSLVRSAQSWTYQLQGRTGSISGSHADVVVIDPDHAGNAAKYKSKPSGGRRAVLAYLSIGEAETWRGYWKGCCASSQPSWLTRRTQGWAGNYVVNFWDPGWKSIVAARVRQILAQGYDGFYLDRVDTYENVKAPGGSRAAMIQFVREVSSQARSIKGDAAIIVQNAEELLDSDSYASAIDGIAKEDLFHGASHNGQRNPSTMVAGSISLLKRAKARGKAIFVVEYLSGGTAAGVAAEIRRQGFVPNFAGRSLSN
jgi:cysteinyl-tRNA synthetase, unknown class